MAPDGGLAPWLEQLEQLPFVRAATIRSTRGAKRVRLRTANGTFDYRLEVYLAQPLGHARLAPLLGNADAPREPVLLFAPLVAPRIGEALRARGVQYVDLAGNCHVEAGGTQVAHVEGRKLRERFADPAQRRREGRFHVYFALAARPELVTATVREIARHAGAGKSTVDRTLVRLEEDGVVATTKGGRRIVRTDQLVERWVAGYVEYLRPRWMVSRYQPAEADPAELEKALSRALRGAVWGLGGGAAGWRLDHHYRGPDTVVHIAQSVPSLAAKVRALPAREGPLAVIRTPLALAFESAVEETVHPLLVYAELVASNDERSLEAAARIRERYKLGQP